MLGFVMLARRLSVWFYIATNRLHHSLSNEHDTPNTKNYLEQFIETHQWKELETTCKEPCKTSASSPNITSWQDYLHHYYDRDWKEAFKKDRFQLNDPNTVYYKFDDEGNCTTLKGNKYTVVVEELNALYNAKMSPEIKTSSHNNQLVSSNKKSNPF